MDSLKIVSYYPVIDFSGGSVLSERTRQRLIALGIDPSTVKNEEEAKQRIEKVLATKKQNNVLSKGGSKGNASLSKIMTEAKILASDAGANIGSTDSIENILDKTAQKIEMMNDNDPRTKYLKERFAALSCEYEATKSSELSFENLMSSVAISNKIALGL